MNIYHLNIKDNDDHKFDVHRHYSHPTKGATNLWEDYNNAYSYVIDNDKEWDINAILNKLETEYGWTNVDIVEVEVEY